MVASIGVVTSPAQGASYYEKDDPAHREPSRWAGKGTEALASARAATIAAVDNDPDTPNRAATVFAGAGIRGGLYAECDKQAGLADAPATSARS